MYYMNTYRKKQLKSEEKVKKIYLKTLAFFANEQRPMGLFC